MILRAGNGASISRRDAILMVLVAFLWALCFPGILWGLPMAAPLPFAALRSALAGFCLCVIGILGGRTFPTTRRAWSSVIGLAVTYTYISVGSMFLAASHVSPGLATALVSVQPILVAILAGLYFRERLSRRAWGGMLLALAGILLTVVSSDFAKYEQLDWIGFVLILVSTIASAIAYLIYKAAALELDPVVGNGLQLLLGAFMLSGTAYYLPNQHILWNSIRLWSSIIVLSGFTTALALVIWQRLLQRNLLVTLNAFTYLTPVFGMSLGIIMFHERPGVTTFIGVLVMLIGVAMVVI